VPPEIQKKVQKTESHQRPLGFSFSVLDLDIPGSEYKENVKTKTTQSEVHKTACHEVALLRPKALLSSIN